MTTETATKSRGIIFTGQSVPQIIAGTKTMTRRVEKNVERLNGLMMAGEEGEWCPYGRAGDLLWVRETWALRTGSQADHHSRIFYKDGTSRLEYWQAGNHVPEKYGYSLNEKSLWRSPRYMPRWASRLTLEVTGVGLERVQEISDEDAMAEGVGFGMPADYLWIKGRARNKYRSVWNSINAKRGYSWESNPWVWVITFKRVEQEGPGA